MTPEKKLQLFLEWAPKIYGNFWRSNLPRHWKIQRRAVYNWSHGIAEVDFRALLLLALYRKLEYFYDRETNTVKKVRKRAK